MQRDEVPQDGNKTLGGHRKAMYARDADGRIVVVPSTGWEVEEIVTTQAGDALQAQAEAARAAARAGTGSPLAYWMYARRMDLPLLAQATGFWQWQVRRHLAKPVAALAPHTLERYAKALVLPPGRLLSCPEPAPGDAPAAPR